MPLSFGADLSFVWERCVKDKELRTSVLMDIVISFLSGVAWYSFPPAAQAVLFALLVGYALTVGKLSSAAGDLAADVAKSSRAYRDDDFDCWARGVHDAMDAVTRGKR